MQESSVFSANLYLGQVVLITGGGTGIGLRLAETAGKLGAKVAICGRRQEKLESAVAHLHSLGIEALWGRCDIRVDAEVEAMVRKVLSKFGNIDVLINNAGGQYRTAAEDCNPKGFDAVVKNNLLGTWRVIYFVVNLAMIPQKKGSILNVIAQIRNGFPGMVHTGSARG